MRLTPGSSISATSWATLRASRLGLPRTSFALISAFKQPILAKRLCNSHTIIFHAS